MRTVAERGKRERIKQARTRFQARLAARPWATPRTLFAQIRRNLIRVEQLGDRETGAVNADDANARRIATGLTCSVVRPRPSHS